MKTLIGALGIGALLMSPMGARDSQKPPLKQGISVQMAVAGHPVEMRAADAPKATVVVITADGKVYVGVEPVEPGALSDLRDATVYVKADSRASYQTVLAALDALRGKTVVLLTAPPVDATMRQGVLSPYGVKLIVPR